MKNISNVYVGVDISKNSLDIYIYPIGRFLKIANSKVEIEKFAKDLAVFNVTQIACEVIVLKVNDF